MLANMNSTPYRLTCSIWTNDLSEMAARRPKAGLVWVNQVASIPQHAFSGLGGRARGARESWTASTSPGEDVHIRYPAGLGCPGRAQGLRLRGGQGVQQGGQSEPVLVSSDG